MKFGTRFRNLLEIKGTKLYSDSFRFHIFIARCLGDYFFTGQLVAWCSGNAFDPINEVTVRRARLVLRWVTACGQVNHFCM